MADKTPQQIIDEARQAVRDSRERQAANDYDRIEAARQAQEATRQTSER